MRAAELLPLLRARRRSYVGQVVNLRPIVNRPGERSSPARAIDSPANLGAPCASRLAAAFGPEQGGMTIRPTEHPSRSRITRAAMDCRGRLVAPHGPSATRPQVTNLPHKHP